MVDTHSSLKTTSLGLDLSSTGLSGLNTGRDENVHYLTNVDDDDEVRFLFVYRYSIMKLCDMLIHVNFVQF